MYKFEGLAPCLPYIWRAVMTKAELVLRHCPRNHFGDDAKQMALTLCVRFDNLKPSETTYLFDDDSKLIVGIARARVEDMEAV